MFLPFILLLAASIGGEPAQAPQPAPRPAVRVPRSRSQAEAAVLTKYNQLVAAMQAFSAEYRGSHTVNARKARAVRQAWREFQTAQSAYNAFVDTDK